MFKAFSDRLMESIADSLATKQAFIIFCIIAFLPLLVQFPSGILAWQQFISQTVIQLIALNVLAIVSKKESQKQQRLLQDTHDIVMNEIVEIKKIISEVNKIEEEVCDDRRDC